MKFALARSQLFASAAVIALMAGPRSFAAESDTPPVAAKLEEVVVTAQKRSEDVNKVPTSISVLSGDALAEGHIANYDDLTRAIPSVSFAAGGAGLGVGEGMTVIEMRGISSSSGAATVGVYLDETSVTVPQTYDGASQPVAFDIDHVEVLRGPQGTLYGASSMGGTIRFIQAKPNLESVGGFVTGDLSGTDHGRINYQTSGVANLPVVEGKFALRLGAYYNSDSGWINNYGLDGSLIKGGVNSDATKAVRVAALYAPTEDLNIFAQINYQRADAKDSPVFYEALGLYNQNKEVPEWSHDTLFVPSVTVTDNLGFAELTSVSSYFWRDEERVSDGTYFNNYVLGDYLIPPYTGLPASNNITTLASQVTFPTTYSTISQEVRLASPANSGSPLKWVAGLYASEQRMSHLNDEPTPTLPAVFQSTYGIPILSVANALGAPQDLSLFTDIFHESTWTYTDQYAVFGQVDYDVTSRLHASAGLRYQFAREFYRRDGGGYYDIGNLHQFQDSPKYFAATPKFSLAYDLDDASSAYATAAKGFRLGGATGPDPSGTNNVCAGDYANLGISGAPINYSQDSLWSYEAGLKTFLADRTVSINGAGYYIDWSNIQQTINLPTCGFKFTTNVGDAESYGGELELRYAPQFLPGLKLSLTGGVNHSAITSSPIPTIAAVGQSVLFAPERTATLGAEYNFPLKDNMSGFVHGDFNFIGHAHGSYQTDNPNYENAAYGVINATAGIDTGSLRVSLYAKNLANDRTIIQRPQIDSVTEAYTVQPLTVGISARKDF